MDAQRGSIEGALLCEAQRLLGLAQQRQLPLRLLGGMGVRLLLEERMDPLFEREIDDLDFITTRKASRDVERLLEQQGWVPQIQFNALHGSRRLLFHDPGADRKLDVFVESFEMCHSLPLAKRIETQPRTLPAAELAMSKLQVVSMNAKDLGDLYALVDALEVAEHDEQAINAAYIAQLTSADWGLHHTFELNLERLWDEAERTGLPPERAKRVRERIQRLRQALEEAPKTRTWRLRARIGERKRWYEEPEEVER